MASAVRSGLDLLASWRARARAASQRRTGVTARSRMRRSRPALSAESQTRAQNWVRPGMSRARRARPGKRGRPMSSETEIRPFRIGFPGEEIAELRRRIAATRWPERETVTDDSQGVRLAMMQDLARYWGTGYDWSTCEAKLNALPNFITEIDGLDIHFIHVRSPHQDAL